MPDFPEAVESCRITALMAGESVVEYRLYLSWRGQYRYVGSFDSLAEAELRAMRMTATTERRVGLFINGKKEFDPNETENK